MAVSIKLPSSVNFIINTLQNAGFEAYAVGGCIRDSLLGRRPNDWDITTSAKPLDVKALFDRTFDTGIEHGTVTVRYRGESFEVTTYRIDGEYEDSRHPKQVEFTSNLSEDLKRRDFTINAMAYNEDAGLVDLFNGVNDLENRIIRAVGNPLERFTEDALRMMRAIRFAAQLDFQVESDTYNAISELSANISNISAERIQVELVKLLESDHPEKMLDLYKTHLTKYFLPEFDACMACPQNTKYHMYDVGTHTIVSLQNIKADKVSRLTMLFHDIAKPKCKITKDGTDHFYGHPHESAIMCRQILKRLKFDNDTIHLVTQLVEWHDLRPEPDELKIRKMIVKVGLDAFPRWFDVKRADALAQSEYLKQEKLDTIDQIEEIYNNILSQGQCLRIKDMAITGSDLINQGLKQGPEIGQVLDGLFKEVVRDPSKNNREYLLERASHYIKQ